MADNDAIIKQLFTALEANLFYGDRLSGREFCSIMSPGRFVSPNMKETTLDMYEIFSMTNDALDCAFLRTPLAGTISGRYNEILEFAALPKRPLTADETSKRDAAEQWIEANRATWKQYWEVWHEFDLELNREQNKTNPDEDIVDDLKAKRDEAYDELIHEGQGAKMAEMQATFAYYTSGDPRTYWNGIVDQFNNGRRNCSRGDYYQTSLDPKPADWGTASWASLSLQISDASQTSFSRSTSWGVSGGASWGLWHFGADYGHSEAYQHQHSDVSNLAIDLEYLRVRIDRPWLSPEVFGYRFWSWLKSHGFLVISDGGDLAADPPRKPTGPRGIPFLPTEMFLVRNVRLAGNFSDADATFFNSHTTANASFGWGPFSCQGSYTEDTETKTATSHLENGALLIPQPQILGWFGTLIPKCPDPDPTLPWGSDVAPTP